MNFKLEPLMNDDLPQFKLAMKVAFNKGAERGLGKISDVLPDEDIDASLNANGAVGYKAIVNTKMVGGAIVRIDEVTQHNSLDFLYVDYDSQNQGIGYQIWLALEKRYPKTRIWETCTPYFDKRNIHFYINRCGFKATKFYNESYSNHNCNEDEDNSSLMFEFEKTMN